MLLMLLLLVVVVVLVVVGVIRIGQWITMVSIDIDLKVGHDRYIDGHVLRWSRLLLLQLS